MIFASLRMPITPFTHMYFPQRLGRTLSRSRFLTVSLAIHIALVAALGGVVLFKTARDESSLTVSGDSFLQESIPEADEIEEPQEFDEAAIEPNPVQIASAVTTLTHLSIPWKVASAPDVAIGNTFSAEHKLPAQAGPSVSAGQSKSGTAAGKMSGTLFGVKIEAAKLGVILDVSSSAHPYLSATFKEIDKNFSQAQIVLYPGCGMNTVGKSNQYHFDPTNSISSKHLAEAEPRSALSTVQKILKRNQANDSYITRFLKKENVWLTNPDANVSISLGCQFAFEYLMRNGADRIYWFADFRDPIDARIAEELANGLRRKGIKVTIHNFSKTPTNEMAVMIAKKTGGEMIQLVPEAK